MKAAPATDAAGVPHLVAAGHLRAAASHLAGELYLPGHQGYHYLCLCI